jgi:hypothetical protein
MQNITKKALSTHITAKKKKIAAVPNASMALGKAIVTTKANNQLKQAALDDAALFRRVGKISPM